MPLKRAAKKNILQRKLVIGKSDTPLEKEADRVAEQVLAAPPQPTVSESSLHIQRFPSESVGHLDAVPASVDHVLATPGRSLEPTFRQDMEQRFGHDFSEVRVYSGIIAEQSAYDVDANAYTVGQQIIFGKDQYSPNTYKGRKLLAHELTHVVQQSNLKRNEVLSRQIDRSKAHPRKLNLHEGLKIKSSGVNRKRVQEILRNIDTDGDGYISQKELYDLAITGRNEGFSDNASLTLFRAGLDAAALAEIKGRERGQQLTPEYIDKRMKPLLENKYGAVGSEAVNLVIPQVSRELTKETAKRIQDKSGFDRFERAEIQKHLGTNVYLEDTNDNSKVDENDRKLDCRGTDGCKLIPLGKNDADKIKVSANAERDRIKGQEGLDEAAEVFKKLEFPELGEQTDWRHKSHIAKWMGKKSHDEGGAWECKQITKGRGSGFYEFKLDITRINPAEALVDIKTHPENYCMDCAMAAQTAQYIRLRQQLGDKKFNQLAKKHGMIIGHSEAAYRSGFLAAITSPIAEVVNKPLKDWEPGWKGYAKISIPGNNEANDALSAQWSGEHFTVATISSTGKKIVLAHPFVREDKNVVAIEDFEQKLREKVAAAVKVQPEQVKVEIIHALSSDPEYARNME